MSVLTRMDVCPRCRKLHQPSAVCPGLTRRRFIFLGTAAAAAVVAGPLVELAAPPELAIDWGRYDSFTIDGLLKEFYEPVLREMINNKNALTRFLIEDGRLELPV